MSLAYVRAALETQLDATLNIAVAYENVNFSPTAEVPYAQAFLLPAQPDNAEIGPGYSEQGIFQISLFYPEGGGPAAATAVAESIRAAFPMGATFTANGTAVNIIRTPEISPARAEDDRWLIPVKVRWSAYIS